MAKAKDKADIKMLRAKVTHLQTALKRWEEWYWQSDPWSVSLSEVVCPNASRSKDLLQVRFEEPVQPSCIDYSKWDRMEFSSDDEEDAEGHWQAADAGQEQDEDEDVGTNYDEENICEIDVRDLSIFDREIEEYDETSFAGSGDYDDDADDNDDGDAEDEMEIEEFTECCADNKKKLLVQFHHAYEAVKGAVAEIVATHERHDGKLEQLQQIRAVEKDSLQKFLAYSGMLQKLNDQQVHKAGAEQLSQMIGQTQKHLLANVAELCIDLGIT